MLVSALKESPHKVLIAGDFNNTSFSYIYDLVKQDGKFKDAFLEAGSGFGKSFKLNYFPLRIDFLLIEDGLTIKEFRKFDIDYSDHYPILTKIKLQLLRLEVTQGCITFIKNQVQDTQVL